MLNSSTSSPVLCGQLAETCLLQCYLIEAIDRQQLETCVRRRAHLQQFAHRALDTLRQHTVHLTRLLAAHPVGQGELRKSSARFGGRLLAFVGQDRARVLAGMLRDDYTLMRLTIAHYTALQANALSRQDQAVAALAHNHLRALATLSRDFFRQLRRLTPRKPQGRTRFKDWLTPHPLPTPFDWPNDSAAA